LQIHTKQQDAHKSPLPPEISERTPLVGDDPQKKTLDFDFVP
jgi:hypothetical protein